MGKRAFAVAAHPDDIEFLMAGTLILLGEVGYEIHYMNIANGSCGTSRLTSAEIIRIRRGEARAAAASIGAVYHESLVNDIEIFYEKGLLAKVGAVMREVSPEILLVPAPSDYMEDHQNAARLAVAAAFCRSMPNFPTDPPRSPVKGEMGVYHAQPVGNREPLGAAVRPGILVDISSVIDRKRTMLSAHGSQKEWLDRTQGIGSYLDSMEAMAREAGAMTGTFECAEGWRRRLHVGFGAEDFDPLCDALGEMTETLAAE